MRAHKLGNYSILSCFIILVYFTLFGILMDCCLLKLLLPNVVEVVGVTFGEAEHMDVS